MVNHATCKYIQMVAHELTRQHTESWWDASLAFISQSREFLKNGEIG
jgi:hypothetical protein